VIGLLSVSIVFSLTSFAAANDDEQYYSATWLALYAGLHRTVWSLLIAAIIVLCHFGYGGK
jgi:hypothetical protein